MLVPSCAAALLTVGLLVGQEAEQTPDWAAFTMEQLADQRAEQGRPYLPFLNVPDIRMGLYELAAGADDRQQPHGDDEVYYIVKGRATLEVGDEKLAVAPGSVVYVKAQVSHRFVDITEDLQVLVFFASK